MKENILIFAYNLEKESAELYASMAKKATKDFVRIVFNDLAQEETKHQEMLEKIIHRQAPANFPNIPDLNLSATLTKPPLDPNMTPEQVITYVIKMEEEAIILYQALHNATNIPGDKDIYAQLIKMESCHKYRFERVLQDISSWNR